MSAKDEFDKLKKGHAVGHTRRVWHSTTNYFSGQFGGSSSGNGAQDRAVAGVNAANNAYGHVSGAVGAVGGVLSLAGGASAAVAATALVLAAPVAAVASGVVGIVNLAQNTYSNRDGAHMALRPYIWNLVDEDGPETPLSADNIDTAGNAATKLLDDGSNQIKLIGTKLTQRGHRIQGFLQKLEQDYVRLKATAENEHERIKRGQSSRDIDVLVRSPVKALKERWETAARAEGAVFEYVRRLIHTGNYLQAPMVLGLAMQHNVNPGSVDWTKVQNTDFFAGSQLRTNAMEIIKQLSNIYNELARIAVQFGGP